MTATSTQPRRTQPANAPIAFARAPTSIRLTGGAWEITHRGDRIGRCTDPGRGHDEQLLAWLRDTCRLVISIELEHSAARARATAAARPDNDPGTQRARAARLIKERARINTRVLVRRAVNTLGVDELLALTDTVRHGHDDSETEALLTRIAASAAHDRQMLQAAAATTIALAGVPALRDALTNRAGRRRNQRATTALSPERTQQP